jgi:hypothetical protein
MATRCEYGTCTKDAHYLRTIKGKTMMVCDKHKNVK